MYVGGNVPVFGKVGFCEYPPVLLGLSPNVPVGKFKSKFISSISLALTKLTVPNVVPLVFGKVVIDELYCVAPV